MGKYLGREDILQAQDVKTVEVKVPEWGGVVLVRGLTGAERDALEAEALGTTDPIGRWRNFRARVVARAVVDEQGQRVFTDADIEALGRKSATALDRVFAVAARLSGLTAADMEALEGNSGNGQSAGPGSG